MKKLVITWFISTFLIANVLCGVASANDPRDYIAAPEGTRATIFYFKHITGNQRYAKGDKVGTDTNLSMNLGIFRPVYYTKIGSFTVAGNLLLPFGDASLDGKDVGGVQNSTSGLGDPTAAAGLWFIDNPKSQTWLGVTQYATMPLGEYNNIKNLNMGSNRWAYKTELGFVKGFGKLYFDIYGNVEFYTDNNNYTIAKSTLEQDPVYCVEGHISYDITKDFFASVDYYYSRGGETTVQGIKNQDEKNDHAAQLSFHYMLTPSNSILLQYKNDLKVENGIKTNTFGIRYAYFF